MPTTIRVPCLLLLPHWLGCRCGQFNIASRARWPLGYLLELIDQIPQLVTVRFARVIWCSNFFVILLLNFAFVVDSFVNIRDGYEGLMGYRLKVWLLALVLDATESHCSLVLLIRQIGRLMLLSILNVTLHWTISSSGSCLGHHISWHLDDETIGDSGRGC